MLLLLPNAGFVDVSHLTWHFVVAVFETASYSSVWFQIHCAVNVAEDET